MEFDVSELDLILSSKESEHLEFKEAKNHYSFEELARYCSALANEGGGRFVLGVSDDVPHRIVGTRAFESLERTKQGLVAKLHHRIDADEVMHTAGRILIFTVPSHPIGYPIECGGAFWMRSGDSLMPMTQEHLRRIFDETTPDFSARICPDAKRTDLDPLAVTLFRETWHRKSGNSALLNLDNEQLLSDSDLVRGDGITYAALVLLGKESAVKRLLPQAEVVFEYRMGEASGPAQYRREYRKGFFLYFDDLWEEINRRNDVQHFQDGLFMWDIFTFNETVVREAVLNAVSHRDYRLGGSVFIRQYPRRMEVDSPGGFPQGITIENILWRQNPVNRCIATALACCGFVERSGQGVNRMFDAAIRESKAKPDYSGTDAYHVCLLLSGVVQHPEFIAFLERVGNETLTTFGTDDLLALDCIHAEQKLPERLKLVVQRMLTMGIVERVGRGRGSRFILGRRFFTFVGRRGTYTRTRGLDEETNKELLLRHIREGRENGSRMHEFKEVLPALSRGQIQRLLRLLTSEGRIHCVGDRRGAKWHAGSASIVAEAVRE